MKYMFTHHGYAYSYINYEISTRESCNVVQTKYFPSIFPLSAFVLKKNKIN